MASVIADLLAALSSRLQRFAESGDRAAVLDPAALAETVRLSEAVLSAGPDQDPVSLAALTAAAHLHLARYQLLPDGEDQDDLRSALSLFSY